MPALTNNTSATPSLIDTLTRARTHACCAYRCQRRNRLFEQFSSKCSRAVSQSGPELNNHLLFISQSHGCKDKTKAIHHFYTAVGEQVLSLWTYPILKVQKVQKITVGCGKNEINKKKEWEDGKQTHLSKASLLVLGSRLFLSAVHKDGRLIHSIGRQQQQLLKIYKRMMEYTNDWCVSRRKNS